MPGKRYPRGFRQFDNDTHLDSPTRRDNASGQPRLPLVIAAFLLFAAGTLLGMLPTFDTSRSAEKLAC